MKTPIESLPDGPEQVHTHTYTDTHTYTTVFHNPSQSSLNQKDGFFLRTNTTIHIQLMLRVPVGCYVNGVGAVKCISRLYF